MNELLAAFETYLNGLIAKALENHKVDKDTIKEMIDDAVENIDIDYSELSRNLDYSDLASEITMGDLAEAVAERSGLEDVLHDAVHDKLSNARIRVEI